MKAKRSLLLRLVAGQLLVVIVFSLIAMGNLVWQTARNGAGDHDLQMIGLAKIILAKLDEKNTSPELLAPYLEGMGDVLRSGNTASETAKTELQVNFDIVLRVADKSGQEIYRTPERFLGG
jgi:hypothetical protein